MTTPATRPEPPSRTRASAAVAIALASCAIAPLGCAPPRPRPLTLQRVVLYQNGLGYFEHTGRVRGQSLTLYFRSHEIDDVLKTIAIIDAGDAGDADDANAAGAGRGGDAEATGTVTAFEPKPAAAPSGDGDGAEGARYEAPPDKIGLRVSLARRGSGDVLVAYAMPTPTWKAAYRIVFPDADAPGRSGGAESRVLLQGWAAINNTSEHDWTDVELTLATGAPLSFAIDLRTPQFVARPDLTGKLVKPVVRAAVSATRSRPGDADGDGIPNADDLCPDDAEDRDGWQDGDGCPDPDNDHDRILDADDQCPGEPETYNGVDDGDGCPDRGRIVVTDTNITVLDKLYFAVGSAAIKPQALPIIDAVAETLNANPDIRKLEIEGHASDDEPNAWAVSQRRASAVRAALRERGVTQNLVAVPFGPSYPLDRRKTPNARAKNRRVEFLITERSSDSESSGDTSDDAGGTSSAARADRLERSVRADAKAEEVAGTVRYRLADRVTIPAGTSTLVPIINRYVPGEDIYLYRPDPAAPGTDVHPMRAARIENDGPLPLTPGPVAMFARGTFVGEGLIEDVHGGETALIPYAIDRGAFMRVTTNSGEQPVRVVAMRRGEITIEDRSVHATSYELTPGGTPPGRVFIRHVRKQGYRIADLPPGTEESGDALLIPLPIRAGAPSVLTVEETRPEREQHRLIDMSGDELAVYVQGTRLPAELAAKLTRATELRARMSAHGERMDAMRERLSDLSERADQIRDSLRAIERNPRAGKLRRDLLTRLTGVESESAKLAAELGAATAEREAARALLVEALDELTLEEPKPPAPRR